jgi:hypothetical protein
MYNFTLILVAPKENSSIMLKRENEENIFWNWGRTWQLIKQPLDLYIVHRSLLSASSRVFLFFYYYYYYIISNQNTKHSTG